jgi:hypothetical protein
MEKEIGIMEQGMPAIAGPRFGYQRPAYTDPEFIAQGPHAWICNVSDQEYRPQLGIPGAKAILACKPGEAYALTEIEPVIVRVDIGQGQEPGRDAFGHPGKWGQKPFSAQAIAEDLVGVHSTENLERFGVFVIPDGRSAPSEAELVQARERLRETCGRMVFEGDLLWSRKAGNPDITDAMRRAAKWLGLERPWAYTPREMATCPGCGERLAPNVAVHVACGAVLDREKAIALGILKAEDEVLELPHETELQHTVPVPATEGPRSRRK